VGDVENAHVNLRHWTSCIKKSPRGYRRRAEVPKQSRPADYCTSLHPTRPRSELGAQHCNSGGSIVSRDRDGTPRAPWPRPSRRPQQQNPEWQQERRVLSVQETADALDLTKASVYRAINSGKLGPARVGARRFIPLAALDALLAAGPSPMSPEDGARAATAADPTLAQLGSFQADSTQTLRLQAATTVRLRFLPKPPRRST
jgi:excisionase family DNA binding protein